MRDSDRQKFAQVMTGVAELYGKSLSDELLEIYWRSLAIYEIDSVTTALNRHVMNTEVGQFMPKPADVARAIEGSGTGRAGFAWTMVADAVKFVGSYETIVLDDPISQAVIADMGGWISLCESLQDRAIQGSNFPFVARDFERRYRAYLENPSTLKHPKSLTGRIDAENLPLGSPPRTPMLIGDRAKAQLVQEGGRLEPKQLASPGGEWHIAKLLKESA
jgi:hypothetical protein